MQKIISHNKPSLDKREIEAMEEAIAKAWVASGSKVIEFENRLCNFLDIKEKHAVATSSGSSALYVALKILDIRKGDEVILPTYVCVSVLNSVYLTGGKPILVDINKGDFNVSYEEIINKTNWKTKAIIVPHTFGVPQNIEKLKTLDIKIIEDCAQAVGSRVGNKHVGILGDLSVFSFYASKVITTGYGGMIVSKNIEYINSAKEYLDPENRLNYYPSFNFNMSDINAAMGCVQVQKLNNFLEKRQYIANQYMDICSLKGWSYQKTKEKNAVQNWYRFVVIEKEDTIKKLQKYLADCGINTIVPIATHELLHKCINKGINDYKVAELISNTTLSLPIYPRLIDESNLERILEALKKF